MDYDTILAQVLTMLHQERRLAYRVLKRRLQLDDDLLEDLKDDLIYAKKLAVDEDGRVLVWTGGLEGPPVSAPPASPPTPEPTAQADTPPAQPPPPEAERRQLTVMFCDLVGSTPLAAQLDPEDYREVVRAYQQTCADVIQRFAGYIAQYLGDGLLVYFGYPQAHEDDAHRAVRAGLDIIHAVRALNTRLEQDTGITLAVRLGIHTGLVVVGAMGGAGRHEQLALGEVPNVASRIQGVAEPNTVAMSAATSGLVQGYFECQELGAQALRGVSQPIVVYRVLRESGAQSRLEVASTRGLTPLVGRDSEVTFLLERWNQVKDGQGQVVLLSGEGGIGKSRLVEVLRERVRGEGATRIAFRCSPYHQNSALYPVIDHLQRFLQWHRDDTPEAKLDTLERVLRTYQLPLAEVLPLFAVLLSVSLPERYPPLHLTPQRQRQKTHEALVAWLLEEAERQPVLVVWEDLHWADPSTLEVLGLVLDQASTARMLTLLTCRPEFRPSWATHAPVTQVTLTRLGRLQVATMITHLTGGKALPVEVVQQIVAKTDGVPLFVEELTKTVRESGLLREREDRYELTGPLPPLAIPATLHDSLMARLDRLAPVKAVAQLGAVLGRTFAYELLQAMTPLDEASLQQALTQLVDAELLYQRGLPPQATYTFKHALIQDAAYESLLRSTRQQYHQRIAQLLEAQFAETVETQPELLAQHYTEAGLAEQAVGYWYKAGQRAHERSAHVEAIGHLTKGLEVLTTLPDTLEHRQQELALQLTLGRALMATKGLAAPDTGAAYHRARELCQQVGETPQIFPVLGGLVIFYLNRGEVQTARELGEQMLSLAQRVQDPADLAHAHISLGNALYNLREWDAARTHLEQGIAFYNAQQPRSQGFLTETHQGVFSLIRLAQVLWELGYPDQAVQRSREALTLARELAHPASVVTALFFTADIHMRRREGQRTYEQAEAALVLAREHGFAFRVAQATTLRGWALVEQGQGEAGIAQICQGQAALRATGSRREAYLASALLAEAYGKVGQREEGLRVIAEALAKGDSSGAGEVELYRVKGELLLRQRIPDALEAETCFRQALDIARRQQAKSRELRAAMSLARLWQQQGKCAEARELLAPIYGWFTEGFDTADLQDAQVLLAALA